MTPLVVGAEPPSGLSTSGGPDLGTSGTSKGIDKEVTILRGMLRVSAFGVLLLSQAHAFSPAVLAPRLRHGEMGVQTAVRQALCRAAPDVRQHVPVGTALHAAGASTQEKKADVFVDATVARCVSVGRDEARGTHLQAGRPNTPALRVTQRAAFIFGTPIHAFVLPTYTGTKRRAKACAS
jgi:hypothetical protein